MKHPNNLQHLLKCAV